MNESKIDQILLRLEHPSSMNRAEQEEVLRLLRHHPELIQKLVDRRAIDGMLSLLSAHESSDELFVERCVSKFSDLNCPPDRQSILITDRADKAPSPLNATSMKGTTEPHADSNRIAFGPAKMGWLAVAATIIFALGTWTFLLVGNMDESEPVAGKADRPRPSSTKPLREQPRPREPWANENVAESADNPSRTRSDPDANEGQQLVADDHADDNHEWVDTLGPDYLTELDDRDKSNSKLADSSRPDPVRNAPKSVRLGPHKALTFASVRNGKDAVWKGELTADRLGVGRQQLVDGSSVIQFDNGVLVRLLAPAEMRIEDEKTLRLERGNFIIEIPRKVKKMEIATPHAIFQDPENARVQLIIDPTRETESLVSRGRLRLGFASSGGNEEPIVLSKNGLSQSVVRPANSKPWVPAVTIARGEQEFIGRIGKGVDSIVLGSPAVFANVIERIEGQLGGGSETEFRKNWSRFTREVNGRAVDVDGQQFRELVETFFGKRDIANSQKNLSDVFGNGSSNFQGSLSINGEQRQFNSREEYEKAKQRMFDGNLMPDRFGTPPDPQPVDVRDSLILNGRPLEFSSPDVFHDLRKRMDR